MVTNIRKSLSVTLAVYKELDDLMYNLRLPSFNTLLSVMIPVMKQEVINQENLKFKQMIDGTNPATE